MIRKPFTICLLLVAMLLQFSGSTQLLHKQLEHGEAAIAVQAQSDHSDNHTLPDAPEHSTHSTCAICFVLAHTAASLLDLHPTPPIYLAVTLANPAPRYRVASSESIALPPSRGPPHTHI